MLKDRSNDNIKGKQTAVSSYPCPYCDVSLSDLRSKTVLDYQDMIANGINLTTFDDLNVQHVKFQTEYLSEFKDAKFAQNCVHECLIEGEKSEPILSIASMPQMHVMEGLANHIYFNGIVKTFDKETMENNLKELGIHINFLHGEQLNGNNSKKLLDKADDLMNDEIDNDLMLPYVNALKATKSLVDLTFNSKNINPLDGPKIELAIKNTKTAIINANLSITLKAHILIAHTLDALLFSKGKNLGYMSEQAGEAIHADFLNTCWQRYKTSLRSKNYSENLKKAVVDYSSNCI